MTFFKILQDDKVVSVGCVFLKWNTNRHKMYICDVNEGQFVQTYDEKQIYRDVWMKEAPQEANNYLMAKVIVIDETEYNDIKAMLDEGEDIPIQVEIPIIQQPSKQPEVPEEEKPMTIAEMRKIILKQQEQIDALLQRTEE